MRISVEDEVLLIGTWERLLSRGGASLGAAVLEGAKSRPNEEVLVCSASTPGKVRPDGRGFNAKGTFKGTGGQGEVVINWQSLAHSEDELTASPPSPEVTLNETKQLPRYPPLTLAQAKWTFDDGSTITAVGSGFSVVTVGVVDDVVAMRVTEATGRFEGMTGLVTVNGSIAVEKGGGFLNRPGASATQLSTQTFRLGRA